jgi:hypothetical protein
MAKIMYTHQLPFDNSLFLVHVSSENKVYVRFDELCNLLGLDWRKQRRQMLDDAFLSDKMAVFPVGVDQGGSVRAEDALFFDFGALSYWLDSLMQPPIKRLDLRERVMRFAREYASMSWTLAEHGFVTPYSEEWKPAEGSGVRFSSQS